MNGQLPPRMNGQLPPLNRGPNRTVDLNELDTPNLPPPNTGMGEETVVTELKVPIAETFLNGGFPLLFKMSGFDQINWVPNDQGIGQLHEQLEEHLLPREPSQYNYGNKIHYGKLLKRHIKTYKDNWLFETTKNNISQKNRLGIKSTPRQRLIRLKNLWYIFIKNSVYSENKAIVEAHRRLKAEGNLTEAMNRFQNYKAGSQGASFRSGKVPGGVGLTQDQVDESYLPNPLRLVQRETSAPSEAGRGRGLVSRRRKYRRGLDQAPNRPPPGSGGLTPDSNFNPNIGPRR